ncbi:MAG: hypothetical protein JNL29_11810 [Nitrospira sp.]|nr:hypothetical protein [Nitrospira sp.]
MRFLERYGAASSYFKNYNNDLDCRCIVECGGNMTGMVLHKRSYFLPTLVPDNRLEAIREYFGVLADSLVSSWTKLFQVLPEWTNAFQFDEEKHLHDERNTLAARMKCIDDRIECLKSYKSILALSHQELVNSTIKVFRDGLGIAVDPADELREDFKLLNSNKKPLLLCEVKSTNRGVAREHVNQADSHRERSGFDPRFPSLLIINTGVKKARSVAEKDEKIAREQIQHARRNNILIIRTLDLLFLLRQYLAKLISRDEVVKILTTNSGWLRVNQSKWWVVKGDESEASS